MNFLPNKSLLKDQSDVTIEGRTYRAEFQIYDHCLLDLPDEFIQHQWLRLYEKIICEIAKMGMGTRDYFVLKIEPFVRETTWGETTLRLDAEINAVQHKEISVPVPHFEPYPVTLSYLFKQWKADTKYNVRRWWKRIFK